MRNYEILPIGDKIKNLRQKYNLKQEEISGDAVTRNLISQIENGKANLTKNVAETVIYNLNKLRGGKNIKIDETVEYLMESEKAQAIKILDKYIKELKDLSIYNDNSFINKLAEVENFLVKWNITDKKIAVFDLAGDYFARIKNYYKSSLYYEKAKALMDMYSKNSISILRKLSVVYYYMGEYEQNIKCCEFALDWFNDLTDEYKCIFLYNSSLCYTKLEKYDITLKKIDELEKIVFNVDKNKYYEVILHKALCYQCLKEYSKSLDIYNEMLNYIDKNNYEIRTFVLINLAEIYIKISDFEKAKQNLKLVLENINNIDESLRYVPSAYLEIGKIYKDLKDLKSAEKYYLKALSITKKYMQFFIVEDILNELLDIYIQSKNTDKIEEMKNEFYLLTGRENKLISSVMNKLIEFYLDVSDLESLREIFNFSKKFM